MNTVDYTLFLSIMFKMNSVMENAIHDMYWP